MGLKRKSRIKRICTAFLMVIVLFLLYKILICGHTMPNFNKNGIAEYDTVELGGVKQDILIRGKDTKNPVLLYVHGGPGNPETSFIVPYQSELEEYFVVVNWDQRGAGRSYDAALKSEELSTERICTDALELTHYLKERFGAEKIYLAGHSYGTYVGMRCIQEEPESFYAYIGMGQIGNQQDNERYLQKFAYEQALADGNDKALEELAGIEKGTYTKEWFGKELSTVRKWCNYYGGTIYGSRNANVFTIKAILGLEYSLKDLVDFVKGENLYYTNTEHDVARWELYCANLQEEIPEVEVPVYFIQGTDDYCVTYQSCEEYFDRLIAPDKKLFPIKECAHNPLYEKTEEVSRIIISLLQDRSK